MLFTEAFFCFPGLSKNRVREYHIKNSKKCKPGVRGNFHFSHRGHRGHRDKKIENVFLIFHFFLRVLCVLCGKKITKREVLPGRGNNER
jgi:hypothetical protein